MRNAGTILPRCHDRGTPSSRELGDFAAAAVRGASTEDAEGLAELMLPIESIAQAASMLIGFGDEVEALGPQKLRTRIAETGLAAARRHALGLHRVPIAPNTSK